ncbi:hypothetical protein THTE_1920 [Thermogutta terrifontis]|uniref:Uncharacterized protein n=1 Tax=Thermogutta terrifontis TaxID=1331910 RepID=A0A286RF05_9BACT|nr:hypothetical protein THTE_1920 [Thermogutta terrifontis]
MPITLIVRYDGVVVYPGQQRQAFRRTNCLGARYQPGKVGKPG